MFEDALGGRERVSQKKYLDVVNLEGGVTAAETLFIG